MPWFASVLIAMLLATVVCANAQDKPGEIETDRPDVTPYTVPKTSVQLENGIAWTGDEVSRAVDLTETLLRIGVTDNLEVRFGVPTYFHNLDGRFTLGSGFNDLLLGVKRRLGEIAGFDVAFAPALSVPTGSDARSSHGFDPQFEIPWQRDLPRSFDISGTIGVFYLTEEGRRKAQGENQVELEKRLNSRADIFFEYQSFFGEGLADNSFQMGGGYKVRPNHRIDCFIVVGLSRAASNIAVGVGYSFRLDKVLRK